MSRPVLRLLVHAALWGGAALAGAPGAGAQSLAEALQRRLQTRLAAAPGAATIRRFYERRSYRPAWSGDEGPLPRASDLLAIIADAAAEGLRPADYPLPRVRPLLDPDILAEVDLALTSTALAYGSDLAYGRIDPAAVDTQWSAAPRRIDPASELAAALDSNRVATLPQGFAPPHPGYARLRLALARYRAIAARGGWPALASGTTLVPGGGDARVPALRARLAVEGDLALDARGEGEGYEAALEQAVRRFQRRHGLEADGSVGPGTLAALNVPVEHRVRQIERNLERWRWLPRQLGPRYIMVNSAAFELELVDSGRRVMTMRAIVGRRDWPTPIVSAQVSGLIFSPVWSIPRAIAVQEVLPQVRGDTGYLARERIRILRDSALGAPEVDPTTVDWSALSESTFAFQLVQDPGGHNPLGGVKFVFTSRFNVYIHDTPVRALFQETVRTFSHGCVRVDRAADLARNLLRDPSRWPEDSVLAAMSWPKELRITLPEPIPVHLSYWTAWVEEDGTVEFREDVYGWDAQLAAALAARR